MDFTRYTNRAQQAVLKAQGIATEYHHTSIEPAHVFLSLMEQEDGLVPRIIQKIGVGTAAIQAELGANLRDMPRTSHPPSGVAIGRECVQLFTQAEKEAKRMRDEYTSTEHLLLALARSGNTSALLERNGITYDDILHALQSIRGGQRISSQDPESTYESLSKYGRELTADARQDKLDPVIGRDEEIRRLIHVISRRSKNNPVLIGEAGVGKTAIAEGLAQRIVNGDVPEGLRDKTIIALDMAALVAGCNVRAEFEERLQAVLKEIADS